MKPYFSLFRVRLLGGLQYRAAAVGGLVTQFFWGVMLIFIFSAFYGDADYSNGFSFSDLVTYVWLQQAFLMLVYLYDWDAELFDMITSGGISYELCRPVNLYEIWYVKLLSKRLAGGLLRFSPTLAISFLLPHPYNLSLPHSPLSLLLFFTTLCLGLLLIVSISMMIYISVFKTMHPAGSMLTFSAIGAFFSGVVIPIPIMPLWLQNITLYMPFRWTADLPFRVYSGHMDTEAALVGIAMQIFWITILVLAGVLIMRRVTRLSMVQGG